ncbi:MAG: YsnF/AvaK domain-containing protein [Williamsia sp.]|nr:YsnF/AvaK domain-containing protein [Williamsia sp.]
MSQTVIGIFDNASEAQDAVEQLVKEGFDRSAIDVSTASSGSSSNTGNSDFSSTGSGTIPAAADTGSYGFGTSSAIDTSSSNYNTGSSDSGTGSSYGTSSSSDHKEGESKIGRFFRNLFGGDDDDNDNRYSRYSNVAEGRSIVTVHAKSADEAEDAADILDDYGAINIDEDSTYGAGGTANTSTNLQSNQATGETASIPVIEEQLQVGKKTVETGGVRLRSRIVERPVEENLRLREERVYVDRTPVNRRVDANELENFREGTIELTESAEVPVVAKEAYVKEEVRVGKDVNEREETIRDTVRSTEVDVENLKSDQTNSSSNTSSSSGTYNTGSSNL